MKQLLFAAAILVFATGAIAGEVRFPSDEPIAAITIPEGWTVEEDDGALDVSSPGDSVYVGIEAAANKDARAYMNEWAIWMRDQGVKPDEKTRKDSRGTVSGMPYTAVDSDGDDKDGRVSIFFAALQLSNEHQVLFVYWASKEEQAPYLPALRAMLRSVRPLP